MGLFSSFVKELGRASSDVGDAVGGVAGDLFGDEVGQFVGNAAELASGGIIAGPLGLLTGDGRDNKSRNPQFEDAAEQSRVRFQEDKQKFIDFIKNDEGLDEISRAEFIQAINSDEFSNPATFGQFTADLNVEITKAKNKEGKFAIREFLETRRDVLEDMPGRKQLLQPGQKKDTSARGESFNRGVSGKSNGAIAVRELEQNAEDPSPVGVSQKIAAASEGRGLFRTKKTQANNDQVLGGTSIL